MKYLKKILKIGEVKNYGKHLATCAVAVFFMGFFISLLLPLDYGTDPASFVNNSIALRFGLLLGTTEVIVYGIFLVFVLITSGIRTIGPGTFLNMFLIGYIADFFRWVWRKTLSTDFFTTQPQRLILFIIALCGFIIAAAVYMNSEMGTAPYDSVPIVISEKLPRIPYKIIRMCWDFFMILVGILFGQTPQIGVILMALFLGTVIEFVGKWMKRTFFKG